ncbi:MAG: cytochrome c553 [Candidatus Azotimanducaceae bacterium]|jgi:cytochrome c553
MIAFARAWIFLVLTAPLLAAAATSSVAAATPGEVAAMVCSGCHGRSDNQMPDLSQHSAAQIEAMMLAFRSGERPASLMNRLAKGYSEIEIRAISEALGKM